MGSNSGTVYWMDTTFFKLIFFVKIVLFVCKNPKINEKEEGVGPFFKKVMAEQPNGLMTHIRDNPYLAMETVLNDRSGGQRKMQ